MFYSKAKRLRNKCIRLLREFGIFLPTQLSLRAVNPTIKHRVLYSNPCLLPEVNSYNDDK